MRRRFIVLALLLIIIQTCWVYLNSNFNLKQSFFQELNSNRIKSHYTQFIGDLIIQPSNATCRGKPFIIIIVTSYAGHVDQRNAHRRTMARDLLQSMNVTRIFLLAKIPPREKYISQHAIEDESKVYGDILQGSVLENYHNLTFKILMGLQWASTNCNGVSYILKVDDDTVFNLERTHKLLTSIKLEEDFFMGFSWPAYQIPERNKRRRYYVTWEEYTKTSYPPFVCGFYYITTPNAARRLINEAAFHPFFPLEDVLITGILVQALKIKLVQLPKRFYLEHELLKCCLRDMISEHIMCDAFVGVNNGKNNFIVEFNDAVRFCESSKRCSVRTKERALDKVCV